MVARIESSELVDAGRNPSAGSRHEPVGRRRVQVGLNVEFTERRRRRVERRAGAVARSVVTSAEILILPIRKMSLNKATLKECHGLRQETGDWTASAQYFTCEHENFLKNQITASLKNDELAK